MDRISINEFASTVGGGNIFPYWVDKLTQISGFSGIEKIVFSGALGAGTTTAASVGALFQLGQLSLRRFVPGVYPILGVYSPNRHIASATFEAVKELAESHPWSQKLVGNIKIVRDPMYSNVVLIGSHYGTDREKKDAHRFYEDADLRLRAGRVDKMYMHGNRGLVSDLIEDLRQEASTWVENPALWEARPLGLSGETFEYQVCKIGSVNWVVNVPVEFKWNVTSQNFETDTLGLIISTATQSTR